MTNVCISCACISQPRNVLSCVHAPCLLVFLFGVAQRSTQGDGQLYCLRALRGFRPVASATAGILSVVERWKHVRHPVSHFSLVSSPFPFHDLRYCCGCLIFVVPFISCPTLR
jgi:hypothetical protein